MALTARLPDFLAANLRATRFEGQLLDLIESLGYQLYDQPPEGQSLLQPIRDRSKLFSADMTNLVAIPTERSRDVGGAEPPAVASFRRS